MLAHVFYFAFGPVKTQPFMPHVSSLCCWLWGKEDGEMRERQSCSLMACKVISCGLVKLKRLHWVVIAGKVVLHSLKLILPSGLSLTIRDSWKEAEREACTKQGGKWWWQKGNCNQAQDEKKFRRQKVPSGSKHWVIVLSVMTAI